MQPNKSIQEKLGTLDRLPEGFKGNIGEVWQQLETALQIKRKNNRWWLNRAAIILLILGSVGMYFLLPRQNEPSAGMTAPALQDFGKEKTATAPIVKIPSPQFQSEKRFIKSNEKLVAPGDEQVLNATENSDLLIPEVDTATQSISMAETREIPSAPLTAKPQAPKKLRVVHLNELGTIQKESMENVSGIASPVTDEQLQLPPRNVFPYIWNRKNKQSVLSINNN